MQQCPRDHVEALREEVAAVLAPIGLRLSPPKTRIVHMSDGFGFLGFRIQWKPKKGTRDQRRVYTFIGDRPVRSLKDKIRALTNRMSPLDLKEALIRVNQITRGWAAYFRHAVAKHTFDRLAYFTWWRIVRWVKARRRWTWRDVHRWLRTPDGWRAITADGVTLHNIAATPVTRYRRRSIPSPWVAADHA
jgi:RNA-directed DNA polymerase